MALSHAYRFLITLNVNIYTKCHDENLTQFLMLFFENTVAFV